MEARNAPCWSTVELLTASDGLQLLIGGEGWWSQHLLRLSALTLGISSLLARAMGQQRDAQLSAAQRRGGGTAHGDVGDGGVRGCAVEERTRPSTYDYG